LVEVQETGCALGFCRPRDFLVQEHAVDDR
jgi:hypothetical protein